MDTGRSDERLQQILALTQELIKIKTTEDRPEEHERFVTFVKEYFAETGLTVEHLEESGISSLVVTKGTKTPKVLLCAHFDVVGVKTEDQFEPRVEGDRLYGRGAMDMKSGIAVFMYLMKELAETHHSVGLMLTGDEEIGGFHGTKLVLNSGYTAEVALLPDGGDKVDTLIRKEKKHTRVNLTAHGVSAHSSRLWQGKNAIDILYKAIEKIYTLFPSIEEHPADHWIRTVCTGKFSGGTDYNKVAASARADVDFRLTEDDDWEEMKRTITEFLKDDPIDIEFVQYSMGYVLPEENPLVQAYFETLKEIDRPHNYRDTHGGSDAHYFGQHNIPVIMSQPDGEDLHGPNEWVHIPSIADYDELVRKYVEKVCVQ